MFGQKVSFSPSRSVPSSIYSSSCFWAKGWVFCHVYGIFKKSKIIVIQIIYSKSSGILLGAYAYGKKDSLVEEHPIHGDAIQGGAESEEKVLGICEGDNAIQAGDERRDGGASQLR